MSEENTLPPDCITVRKSKVSVPYALQIHDGELRLVNGGDVRQYLRDWQQQALVPDGTWVNVYQHGQLCALMRLAHVATHPPPVLPNAVLREVLTAVESVLDAHLPAGGEDSWQRKLVENARNRTREQLREVQAKLAEPPP